jgi:hypothetical protein
VLGLLTDPLTWVPYGVIASGAARAKTVAKMVTAGEAVAASDANFWKVWQPIATLRNNAGGALSGSAGGISKILSGKAQNVFEIAYKASNMKKFVNVLSRVSGPEADRVVTEASRLTAYTASRFVKAGAARLISEQSSLAVRQSAQDFVFKISDDISDLKARLSIENEKDLAKEAMSRLDNSFIELVKGAGFKTGEIKKVVTEVLKATSDEKLLDLANKYQSKFQRNALLVNNLSEAENVISTRAKNQLSSAIEAGAREAIQAKRELLAFTNPQNINLSRNYVISNLRYGLGRSAEQAGQIFDELIAPAIRENRVDDALDFIDATRMPAFGRLAEGISAVRNSFDNPPGNRLTLISSRSLTQEVADQLKNQVIASKGNPQALRKIVEDAANQYSDLYESFGGKNLSLINPEDLADDFFKYINENKGNFVRGITDDDKIELTEQALKYQDEARAVGYDLGIAPEEGVIGRVMTLTDRIGREYQARSFAPFADLVDTAFTDPSSLGKATLTYKRNPIQAALNYTFSPRYGSVIAEKVRNKYVIESTKIGMTTREANETLRALRNLSDELKILPRGLAFELGSVERIINSSLSKEAILRISKKSGVNETKVWEVVFSNIFRAYNGDLSDIGILPKFTSWVKMSVPKISIVSDNVYPRLRFGIGAPQFRYIQENIEPVFFRFTSGAGVREQRIAGLSKNDIRTRAIIGEFADHSQVGDAQTAFMQAGNYAAIRIANKEPDVMNALGQLAKGQAGVKEVGFEIREKILQVDKRKRKALEAIISKGMARRFHSVLNEEAPDVVASVGKFFDTTDPEEIAYRIGLDFISRTDPVAMQSLMSVGVEKGLITLKTAEERRLYQNVVEAARKAAADEGQRARRAIYFDPNRPWWERSLNHPLLGIYPLSYMVGKVIPEFVRLMVKTPFPGRLGGDRLFGGVEALRYVSESVIAAEKYDPEFRSWIEDNPEAWVLLQWLVPYTPDNIGFGFSATVRRYAINQGLSGESLDIGRLPVAAGEQAVRASLLGTWALGFNAIENASEGAPDLTEGMPNVLDIIQGKN